jgi:hypothetical protein
MAEGANPVNGYTAGEKKCNSRHHENGFAGDRWIERFQRDVPARPLSFGDKLALFMRQGPDELLLAFRLEWHGTGLRHSKKRVRISDDL